MTGPSVTAEVRPPLRVRVLGGFAIEGFEEHRLGTRKARLLLKRLAIAAGRPVSAGELAAAVWGDHPPQQPHDQVSVLVSRLRAVLGADRLPRTDAGYALAADWFDLLELQRSAEETEARLAADQPASALAAAHEALRLAAGDLLPEEDGDWVDDARPAAARLVARARLSAADAALRAGETGPARAAAQAVLDRDPYDETALRLVMRADARAGRPGAALAAYAAVRHRLSEDLGTDPAPETEALHTAIVRGDAPSRPEAPATSVGLVGRGAELALLDAALARTAAGSAEAVVVEAEAGLGKTALLSTWAWRAQETALVISGRCDELGGDLPLQPVIDGLATYLDMLGVEASQALVGPDSRLLDQLLGRTPATTGQSAPTGSATDGAGVTIVGDTETSRAALFGALSAVLRRAAGERGLVLLVDDLHQAAPGTTEFLAFALRRLPRLCVVAARRAQRGPDLPAAQRITLRPLSVADAVTLVGPERGPMLHDRSGGHPLLLRELAASPSDELSASVVAAVGSQLDRLGDAAASLQAAALCGTEIDAALVAAVTGRPVGQVLDDVERGARTGLLGARDAALAFNHELVREAVAQSASAPRRREIHRAATDELARRPQADPMALARHARLGGVPEVAAQALAAAAGQAADRFELGAAIRLLDQALDLADSAPGRLSRGRLRLAELDLAGARRDAQRAIELGAGVAGFELAGWVAYYGRDYGAALRYADEGVQRATDAGLQASCLALAGRLRHTRGDLASAGTLLGNGVLVAPPAVRGMLQVWQGQLLAHQGEPERAADLARRGLLDPHLAHPFVANHGRFTLAYALGLSGAWAAALDSVDELDAAVARHGDRRFPPMAANLRGWLLRGAGLVDESEALHRFAAEADPGPTFQEARYAALLDIAECHLARGATTEAGSALAGAASVVGSSGSMSWRHAERYRLLAARLGSLSGDHQSGAAGARAVASAAQDRGDRRYELRARLVAATIEARAGRPVDREAAGTLAREFVPRAGPDGWRDLGELARALGSPAVWRQAETQAAAIVAQATTRGDVDGDRVARAVRGQLDRCQP